MGHPAIIVGLLVFLGMAVAWSAWVWSSVATSMPVQGWIALIGGVILSLGLGCGLFWLMFQSNRRGYDDRAAGAQAMKDDADEPTPGA